MGEHDAIERVQADQELRLRTSEAALSVLKSQLAQMVSNLEDIKDRIAFLTTGTATHEHITRVEAMVSSAHKRLDDFNREFWKLQAEHLTCVKGKEDTTEVIDEIRKSLTALTFSVGQLQKEKDAITSFFSTRLGTIVDKLMQFVPWILMWFYLQSKLPAIPAVVSQTIK